ncbi:Hypothetical protein ADU72_0723 [Pediococcus damnosus]|uniref:Sulfur reduction protein DsrE n=2 Tax=Pediococcus damnosus TaxID=51663 RepID=A0ABM6A3B7_9LACO|nr:DsrE family protein [Pediococcus damnosus]AMV60838.1 Hypothetical protein ADU69_1179 [Pediococcus damnosus]AMV66668.1 Hypothetical protein ADU72_0723 [Pediococcus damnosus]KJU74469.1 sulfur reduction protein DsrE [Pediococcus damnosus LMG 28219]KRN51638.1 hypothetical protein IV84_GL000981 [Pediococcus damnosus]PIO81653.1 hypothetical protein BSQ38_08325 [Pediococcus damnosus]
MKIVFHIDENEKWPTTISNIKNAINFAKEQSTVIMMIVVVNGPAITEYLTPEIRQFIESSEDLVSFHACHNAMNSHQITANQLPSCVKVVPAGIIDLAQLQDQGFRYIKP